MEEGTNHVRYALISHLARRIAGDFTSKSTSYFQGGGMLDQDIQYGYPRHVTDDFGAVVDFKRVTSIYQRHGMIGQRDRGAL